MVKISHHPIHNEVEIHNIVKISKNTIQSIINPKYIYYQLLRIPDKSSSTSSAPHPLMMSPVHQCLSCLSHNGI